MMPNPSSHMSASWHNDAVQKRGESIPSSQRTRMKPRAAERRRWAS